jgi:hypothetical protein
MHNAHAYIYLSLFTHKHTHASVDKANINIGAMHTKAYVCFCDAGMLKINIGVCRFAYTQACRFSCMQKHAYAALLTHRKRRASVVLILHR